MVSRMTTELFHAQLEENIVRAADERKRHQAELQVISRNYESSLDSIERMENEAGESYRCARNAFEKAKNETTNHDHRHHSCETNHGEHNLSIGHGLIAETAEGLALGLGELLDFTLEGLDALVHADACRSHLRIT